MLLLKRELLEELGIDFGGEDAVELGVGVEVCGDVGVQIMLEEVVEYLHRCFTILSCEREVVHLQLCAHIHPAVEVLELVRHIEVALGVSNDGFESCHTQFEDDVLEIAAPIHVRHLDEDGTIRIGKKFVSVVRDAALEVFDDHVFGS